MTVKVESIYHQRRVHQGEVLLPSPLIKEKLVGNHKYPCTVFIVGIRL